MVAKVHRNIMSNCDVAEKDSTSGQPRKMSSAKHKDERVHLAQVTIHHHHSASAAEHGYAAPTVASQLRMKLGGMPTSSPCQRYRPVEPFLPLCHKRACSKTTTAKPSHSKGLTKKMTSESKSSERTVRIHLPNKTSSSGNERLSKWRHQDSHHPLQNNGLKNKSENQQFPSTVSKSQLKDLNCDKGWNKQKDPQIVKTNNTRKISTAKRPDEKGKEVLRGIPPKLNQTKRTVEKKTQSRATVELSKTTNIKKDPLFEQMVEEEQHRWLAEVKQIEDERKEFYCVNENLRINFKVEWISYNIGADPIPTYALVGTNQDLQNRKKDLTENLDIEVNAEKSKDTVFKKMKEAVVDGSRVRWETSVVEGVIGDAYRLSCEETSVDDSDQWSDKEMLLGKADNSGDKIVEEASVEEAGTADFKVNAQQDGDAEGKSAEEILLLARELEKNCFEGKSNAETEPGCFDENYGKGDTEGQKSCLSADVCRLHDGSSSEFETGNGQLVTTMSQAESNTDDSEVKYESENLPEEAHEAVFTGNKESLLEVASDEAEIETVGNNMASKVLLMKAVANVSEADAETFIPNKVSCDTTEGDNVKEMFLQQSVVESEADACEGKSDTAVLHGDAGMGDINGRSMEEISSGKQQLIDDATGQTGFDRNEGEINYVFELHYLANERRNLDSENLQTQSEEGFYETGDSELPVHPIEELEQNVSVDNLTSASVAKSDTESGCLSDGYMSYDDQSLERMRNSSERGHVSLQESLQMSKEKFKSCQEDTVMQSCQEESHLHKSAPRELDNIRNEADLQMSFQRKSNSTGGQDNKGLHGLESNRCSLLDRDGKDLTEGFNKNLKQNLSSKENQKNVKKERAANCDIPYDCTSDLDEDSGFNATVAVRDGASARHSTTVDVVCLDVGSGHASVNPLNTLISDSISA